ncbi:MAG: PSD1 and planctomycete cytochrome C domain-containing protein, partial [Planctomycetota bacterium]
VSNNAAGDDDINFNRDIRPIMSDNCFYCHGQDANKRQAELRLDVREAAIEAGAIVPGDAARSALIERINSDDPEVIMPPPKSNRRLTAEQRDLLQRWIATGAAYESHWAFVPPVRPAEPNVKRQDWGRNAIDRFVLAKLEAEGLPPSPEADRATLIKRLSIDLTGLPPTPEEVDAFVADPDSQAYENLVDRLLASRHYGERMALPWLDAARYADSNGFQQDGDTWQWIWRDWVVRALNDDLPFDQFTIWQLAGDLLPDATIDQQIASGFNRNHLLNGEGGAIAEEQRFVILFDRIDTTATTWLGLTMACAQCHDHKYDPTTRRDYYSLLDAFNRVPESGTPQRQSSRIRVAAPFIELPTEENNARIAEFDAQITAVDADKIESVKKQLADYRGDQIPRVMVMSDAQPRETSILDRGEYLNPTEKVSFATPAFLPPLPEGAPANRLGFAQWLVSPEHSLTARVQVNRMWQYFFGTGIVKTAEDFGVQSEYPIHKDLLDWLAVEFRDGGWSMKKM